MGVLAQHHLNRFGGLGDVEIGESSDYRIGGLFRSGFVNQIQIFNLHPIGNGPVAQLNRASDYGSEGFSQFVSGRVTATTQYR